MKTQSVFLEEQNKILRLDPPPPLHHHPELLGTVDSLFLGIAKPPFHLYAQPFSSLQSPPLQNFPSTFGTHPLQESMGSLPFNLAWLVGSLHFFPLAFMGFFYEITKFFI